MTDLAELNRLLKDFHTLTGMKICVYDGEENELCYYPDRFTAFCSGLRAFPHLAASCRECDESAFARCRRTGNVQIYVCHAGLYECVAPIFVQGMIRGFAVLGQIRPAEGEFPGSAFTALNGEEQESLRARYYSLPAVSRDLLGAAVHILEACAGYELLKNFVGERVPPFGQQLEEYIEAHIAGNLDIESLCLALRLSRRDLYRCTRQAYGVTPADFVRSRRLHCAAKMLSGTADAVHVVAEKCGLGDYNYFSKLFRRHYGMSPREYRKLPESKN